MRIVILFTITVLCFSAFADDLKSDESDEDFQYTNMITLSEEEIRLVSAAFAAACREDLGVFFNSNVAFPYFREFVWKCEREVLRTGSFPYFLADKIFDQKFALCVGKMNAERMYSQLAIDLLRPAWMSRIRENLSNLFHASVPHQADQQNINLIFAFAEDVYVLSSLLSALLAHPPGSSHGSLKARGVEHEIFLPHEGRGVRKDPEKNPEKNPEKDPVFDSTEKEVQFSQTMVLMAFPILLVVNLAAIFAVFFFWMQMWQKRKRSMQYMRRA